MYVAPGAVPGTKQLLNKSLTPPLCLPSPVPHHEQPLAVSLQREHQEQTTLDPLCPRL